MIDISKSGHYTGDCRELLKQLPDGCVQTCVTSPPYWGLRDYGHADQIGQEASPAEYVVSMVGVFSEVRRVLRDDGTLWLNLGDSYLDKSLVGIPWQVALALREDGWFLRSDIIWAKPNPMPESVTDRPTKAHEYVFLLSKNERYFYDADAIREPLCASSLDMVRRSKTEKHATGQNKMASNQDHQDGSGNLSAGGRGTRASRGAAMNPLGANKRSVWTVSSANLHAHHFAPMPTALVDPCVLAGSRPGDLVLDPFFGSGTTGMVAEKHGRKWVGFDLNPEYEKIQRERTAQRSLPMGGTL